MWQRNPCPDHTCVAPNVRCIGAQFFREFCLQEFLDRWLVDFLEDGRRYVSFGDLAKRNNGWLIVLEFDHGVCAMGDATCALRCDEHHLKNIINIAEAILNGNSGQLSNS
jgi:hypothetical protein